jgi:hypothetical protein
MGHPISRIHKEPLADDRSAVDTKTLRDYCSRHTEPDASNSKRPSHLRLVLPALVVNLN